MNRDDAAKRILEFQNASGYCFRERINAEPIITRAVNGKIVEFGHIGSMAVW